jgi:hypothetical protein
MVKRKQYLVAYTDDNAGEGTFVEEESSAN